MILMFVVLLCCEQRMQKQPKRRSARAARRSRTTKTGPPASTRFSPPLNCSINMVPCVFPSLTLTSLSHFYFDGAAPFLAPEALRALIAEPTKPSASSTSSTPPSALALASASSSAASASAPASADATALSADASSLTASTLAPDLLAPEVVAAVILSQLDRIGAESPINSRVMSGGAGEDALSAGGGGGVERMNRCYFVTVSGARLHAHGMSYDSERRIRVRAITPTASAAAAASAENKPLPPLAADETFECRWLDERRVSLRYTSLCPATDRMIVTCLLL